jgi:peptidoglycan/LPS O-acetylase OafA/YrhL
MGLIRSKWIREVDGLRAVACLAVVYEHYSPWKEVANSSLYSLWREPTIYSPGSLGVAFFFTLSAFLLTYLGVREYDRSEHFSVPRFIARRCLRIWPLYFVVVAAYVVLGLFIKPHFPPAQQFTDPDWMSQLWVYVLFLQNWITHRFVEMGILWTLAVEEQFYLIFPLVFCFVIARRSWSICAIFILIALAIGWRTWITITDAKQFDPYFDTSTYLDIFAAGALAGWLVAKGRVPAIFKSKFIGIGILIAMPALGYLGHFSFFRPFSAGSVLVYSGMAVVFSCTLLWVVTNPLSIISRLLRSPVARRLGVLSYGIYMWHIIAKSIVFWLSDGSFSGNLFFITSFTAYVGLAILLAAISYRFVELPFLELKRGLGGDRADPIGIAAPVKLPQRSSHDLLQN